MPSSRRPPRSGRSPRRSSRLLALTGATVALLWLLPGSRPAPLSHGAEVGHSPAAARASEEGARSDRASVLEGSTESPARTAGPAGSAVPPPHAALLLENPRQGLVARFTGEGIRISPSAGDRPWSWGLRLVRFGRGPAGPPVAAAEIQGAGNRVEYRRGALTEWYVNDPRGIEQGFTLQRRPAGAGESEPLTLEMELFGDLMADLGEDESEIAFSTQAGNRVLRYTKLYAVDAIGRPLPAEMRLVATPGAAGSRRQAIRLAVSDAGAVYPITIDPLLFSDAKLTASDLAPLDHFAYSVALSADRALIGSPLHNALGNNSGAATVFRWTAADGWMQEASLAPADLAPLDQFGYSVALSGNRALIGSPLHNAVGDDSGAATVFRWTAADGWMQEARLIPADLAPLDHFGYSVALSGNRALIGSPLHNAVGNNSGAATVFRWTPADGWMQEGHLLPDDLAPLDQFGYSVALSGDRALIGSPLHNAVGDDSGAAYVYRWTAATGWMLEAKLTPADLAPLDQFGYSVALSGDTAIIGSPLHNEVGDDSGAAYAFRWTAADGWMLEAKLTPAELAPLDHFGHAVSIRQNAAVIGSPLRNEIGNNSGTAYLFSRTGAMWTEEVELTTTDLAPLDTFGGAVSIDCGAAVIGNPLHNEVGDNSGAAYVFRHAAMACAGGLPVSEPPEEEPSFVEPAQNASGAAVGELRIRAKLVNTGVEANAKAVAEFSERPDRARFAVQAQEIAPGPCDLLIAGAFQASMNINPKGQGKVVFSSNPEPGKNEFPLSFDPRGQTVELARGADVLLSVVFPDGAHAARSKGKKKGKNSRVEIEAELVATGALSGAGGKIAFQSRQGKEQLRVAISDIPPGDYDLRVGGVQVGSIFVEARGGKIVFSTQAKKNTLPLTFDPRGQLIEVLRNGAVILQVVLPQT